MSLPLARENKPVFESSKLAEIEISDTSIRHQFKDMQNETLLPEEKHLSSSRSFQRNRAREELPIDVCREELMKMILDNQIVIISGATGSGKSTQLCQFVYEDTKCDRICITQPRKIATVSLARRVAEERNQRLGQEVGFVVRFSNQSSRRTRIKYITDGCLVRELVGNPDLPYYNCIILDEAHERSLQTDILFALVKNLCERRPKDLKVIVTSATLNVEKFSEFFLNAPTFEIPGRLYDVQLFHSSADPGFHVDACVSVCLKIHQGYEADEHILCFLTGRKEIENACASLSAEIIELRNKGMQELADILILPAYAALPVSEQQKIFADVPQGCRKVIFATNIAETSLTVGGIVHVVDSGLVKQKRYNPATQMDCLVVSNISQTQAIQRAGRAGRTKPGCCWRLYTKKTFDNELKQYTEPEIQRSSLSSVILLLKSLNIRDISKFNFIDCPSPEAVAKSLLELRILDLIDNDGAITRVGDLCKHFPVKPAYAKFLVYCSEKSCLEEALTVVAMHSVENLFYVEKKGKESSENSLGLHLQQFGFQTKYGDQFARILIYQAWLNAGMPKGKWIEQRKLNHQGLATAHRIRAQLKDLTDKHLSISGERSGSLKSLRKALARCFYFQSARKVAVKRGYNHKYNKESSPSYKLSFPSDAESVYIHPTSLAHGLYPDWIIYSDTLWTTRPFVTGVTTIQLKWIQKLLPKLQRLAPPAKEVFHYEEAEARYREKLREKTEQKSGRSKVGRLKAKLSAKSLKRGASTINIDDARTRYLARKKRRR